MEILNRGDTKSSHLHGLAVECCSSLEYAASMRLATPLCLQTAGALQAAGPLRGQRSWLLLAA